MVKRSGDGLRRFIVGKEERRRNRKNEVKKKLEGKIQKV